MVAGESHELIQSVLFGLLFSFLLAKLISILQSFRDNNLHLVRGDDSSNPSSVEVAEKSVVQGESLGEEDEEEDGLEGIENTELDDTFSAASSFVAVSGITRNLPTHVQLKLYGLYKIATEGPCEVPQPSAIKMAAHAKWQAWHKLGAMPPVEAILKYIDTVTEHYPAWASGSNQVNRGDDHDRREKHENEPMGPVFSTLIHEEECGKDLVMDDIHTFAREGDVDNLIKCLDSNVDVNMRDTDGRTALHWAVDRGHINITELLVNRNGDVNAKDDEGQTPLHYAAICDREEIAKFLVAQNADMFLKDNDFESPYDLHGSSWQWMQTTD